MFPHHSHQPRYMPVQQSQQQQPPNSNQTQQQYSHRHRAQPMQHPYGRSSSRGGSGSNNPSNNPSGSGSGSRASQPTRNSQAPPNMGSITSPSSMGRNRMPEYRPASQSSGQPGSSSSHSHSNALHNGVHSSSSTSGSGSGNVKSPQKIYQAVTSPSRDRDSSQHKAHRPPVQGGTAATGSQPGTPHSIHSNPSLTPNISTASTVTAPPPNLTAASGTVSSASGPTPHKSPSRSKSSSHHPAAQARAEKILNQSRVAPDSDLHELIRRCCVQYEQYKKRVALLNQQPHRKILEKIFDLTEFEKREQALLALSKRRENFPDLAPLLWGTPGVIAALLQEVISVYPYLNGTVSMNTNHSNRCCNALALLQCVASHPETRGLFLRAYIPLFLYPFLNTRLHTRPFEYLRLTSLGVIGALVKHPHPNTSESVPVVPDKNVTEFLVQTEAIPLCLHIMEYGNELSKTVATFIVQKILLDDHGLSYVCKTSERFFAVARVLKNMIEDQTRPDNESKPSKRLIKHVIRCYLRLCDDKRAHMALAQVFPEFLATTKVKEMFSDDESCISWLRKLHEKQAEASTKQANNITAAAARDQQRQQRYAAVHRRNEQAQAHAHIQAHARATAAAAGMSDPLAAAVAAAAASGQPQGELPGAPHRSRSHSHSSHPAMTHPGMFRQTSAPDAASSRSSNRHVMSQSGSNSVTNPSSVASPNTGVATAPTPHQQQQMMAARQAAQMNSMHGHRSMSHTHGHSTHVGGMPPHHLAAVSAAMGGHGSYSSSHHTHMYAQQQSQPPPQPPSQTQQQHARMYMRR